MKNKNMGKIDKSIRIIIAITLVILYSKDIISGTLGVVLLVVALIFTITSLVSFCPIYAALGIHTNKK